MIPFKKRALQASGTRQQRSNALWSCDGVPPLAGFTKVPPHFTFNHGDIHMVWGALALLLLVIVAAIFPLLRLSS